MKNVLLITSSPRGEASHSTQVATDLANEIGGHLVKRDLWRDPLAPITTEFIHAMYTPPSDLTPAQRDELALSDKLIGELRAADTIIVAAGMINFGIPAGLKNWIDHIARKGETFNYGESGAEGLLKGKRLILVLASGAVYSSGPMAAMDHMEPALRNTLGFLGLTDPEVIRMEGFAFGPDATEQALRGARERSKELALA